MVDAYKELSSVPLGLPGREADARTSASFSRRWSRASCATSSTSPASTSRKDNYEAAVARIQYALHNYAPGGADDATGVAADSDLDAEALLLLGKTYLKMHKWSDARQAFETIVQRARDEPARHPGARLPPAPERTGRLSEHAMADPTAPSLASSPSPSSPPPGAPALRTVLVVDDEKNIRRTLQLVLEGEGYRSSAPRRPAQALASWRARRRRSTSPSST